MQRPLSFGFDIAKNHSHPLWRREKNLAICVPKKVPVILTYSAAIIHLPHALVYQIIDIFGDCWLIIVFSLFMFHKDKFRKCDIKLETAQTKR